MRAGGGIVAGAGDELGGELARLLGEQRDVAAGGQRDDAEAVGIGAHDVERLPANGAGAAEDGDDVGARSAWRDGILSSSAPDRRCARSQGAHARTVRSGFHVAFVASGVLADCTTASPALPVTYDHAQPAVDDG